MMVMVDAAYKSVCGGCSHHGTTKRVFWRGEIFIVAIFAGLNGFRTRTQLKARGIYSSDNKYINICVDSMFAKCIR